MLKHEIRKQDDDLYYCELEKVTSVHQNVRTKTMLGATYKLPELNRPFIIYGESLTPGAAFRRIYTTPVISVKHLLDCIEFTTRNSTYRLRGINDNDLCQRLQELSIFAVGTA